MNYVIQVTDLVKSFGKEIVLHHINVNFASGKIHGIIGRNGSGKTMLMKMHLWIYSSHIRESHCIWKSDWKRR